MEHVQDLRSRLLVAVLAIVVATVIGLFFSQDVISFLSQPYCTMKENLEGREQEICQFNLSSPISEFTLMLKVALYMGLVASAPIWMYQLWAFIAPGLHRHERKYAYAFAAIATPLFAGGAFLAYFVVSRGMQFFMNINPNFNITIDLEKYINFYLGVMIVFGLGFEFPLIMLMLNVVGLVTAKRMLSWWRIVVFVSFLFTAIMTPTPDPFGMTALAICMIILYLGAVGIASINDKRRGRKEESLADDESSDIEEATGVQVASSLDEDDSEGEEGTVRRGRFGRRRNFDSDAT
ncbi:twin-arginine translocase subunit TatC [Natronoglycomyces albus]|uniref:Sec-independent protein translocase protein TatC n=1 Tax=Natronoglycomyces albus TaxID=2811108 RepID=A0A895XTY2_9ACTN|nr:twin-arginine translocase subunit TatC [Natronoglycomyces albus]QSB06759.1 twin-arginine translocase subunit TatC [Natronoglycomyces albus]